MRAKKQAVKAVLLAAVVASVTISMSHAEDITWVGSTPGSTDQMVNWSSGTIPGPGDAAIFAGAGGSVSLNGGTWSPQRIDITPGSDNWTFHNGTLQTIQLDNRGADSLTYISHNRIASDVTIRGADYYGLGTYFVASSDYQLRIDGAIVDGDQPTETHLRARLTNNNTYTGRTQAWSSGDGLELLGANGRIAASPQVDVFAANLTLDNATDQNQDTLDDDFNANRLGDTAQVHLRYGNLTLRGRNEDSLTETIGSLTIGKGKNYINIQAGNSESAFETTLHLSNGTASLTRISRGTAQIDTSFDLPVLGMFSKITAQSAAEQTASSGAIPYVVAYGQLDAPSTYLPVIYDKGDDGTLGTSDDVGLRTLKFSELTPITSIPNMMHAVAQGTSTLVNSVTVCRTLSCIDDGITGSGTLTLNATLHVLDGEVILNNSANIAGAATLSLGATEGIIHVPGYGTSTISARVVANNLTKAGDGTLRLNNPTNSITGETIVNGGRLIVSAPTAAGIAPIQLQESDLALEFSSGTFANSTYWESGANGPFGGFAWIKDLRIPDGSAVAMTGRIEGPGALALRGDGARLILSNTSFNTYNNQPFFVLGQNTTLELNGSFGGYDEGGGGYLWMDPNSRLMGTGTANAVVVVQNGARVTPGSTTSPIGKLTVQRLELQSGGTLEIQNGATGTRGVNHDAVDVLIGGAELNGTIKMMSSGAIQPVGATWDVLHFSSLQNGTPAIDTDTPLTGGKQYVPIFYSSKLVIGIAGFTGDANLDGNVNTVDFNSLAGSFGVTANANWLMGDFNFNRGVDSTDFNLFAANYGKKIAGLGPALGATVPEPGVLGSLGAVACVVIARHRRHATTGS